MRRANRAGGPKAAGGLGVGKLELCRDLRLSGGLGIAADSGRAMAMVTVPVPAALVPVAAPCARIRTTPCGSKALLRRRVTRPTVTGKLPSESAHRRVC
jgi:hypothetical protein